MFLDGVGAETGGQSGAGEEVSSDRLAVALGVLDSGSVDMFRRELNIFASDRMSHGLSLCVSSTVASWMRPSSMAARESR